MTSSTAYLPLASASSALTGTVSAFRTLAVVIRTVTGGRPLDLTPKEFCILEVLLAAQGRAVSAEALLQRVWDEFADPFTRTVTITLSRLRAQLGDPPLIETVPRSGYRMGARP